MSPVEAREIIRLWLQSVLGSDCQLYYADGRGPMPARPCATIRFSVTGVPYTPAVSRVSNSGIVTTCAFMEWTAYVVIYEAQPSQAIDRAIMAQATMRRPDVIQRLSDQNIGLLAPPLQATAIPAIMEIVTTESRAAMDLRFTVNIETTATVDWFDRVTVDGTVKNDTGATVGTIDETIGPAPTP